MSGCEILAEETAMLGPTITLNLEKNNVCLILLMPKTWGYIAIIS
jgi:hypothetical protein